MRILYFSRDYTTHDHRFLAALAETEHQVYFLRLERRGHVLEDRPLPPQIEQVSWAGGREPAMLRNGPRLWADLRRVLRQIQPEIVHAGPIQRSALLAALAGARPLISMSWGYDLIADAERGPAWRWATRYTLHQSALLIGDSIVVRQLAQRYGMPDERIVTFPWGVDLEHFCPVQQPTNLPSTNEGHEYTNGGQECAVHELDANTRMADTNVPSTNKGSEYTDGKIVKLQGEQERPFTILSTRTWEPLYDVETIARAFVRAAHQAPQLRLVMLGNGSQAGLLRQIFAQGGVEGRVFLPGQVAQKDLPRYYRSADLYVSASRSDGASISLLEALACGLPALVSDIPGNCEWITSPEHGKSGQECGWRFPLGDVAALAERMLYAAAHPEEMQGMRLAARTLAEERADWRKNFQSLLKAYAQVKSL